MPDMMPDYGWQAVTVVSNFGTLTGEGRNLKRYRRSVNAHRWQLEFTTPPLNDEQTREFFGFLQGLKGSLNSFYYIHPRYSKPNGRIASSNTAKLNKKADAGAKLINIATTLPLSEDYYKIGDPIQFVGDSRVYTVISVSKTDASGVGDIGISPPLSRDLTATTPIRTEDIKFLLMLEDDEIAMEMEGGDGFYTEYTVSAIEDLL
ncbi:hypothetical protein L2750_14470 [Shewanella submarina]|uniref:Phage tail protein n=1 Tax=Shewanella submarina TaxID=2016376 RepID=A0ABV7G8I0_9GAMM|nr:hypothetical protein [Shewanella submarina]MCL1038335.1 hypothetical protein [Shewanella submarina]